MKGLKGIIEDVIVQPDKIQPIIGKINDSLTILLFFNYILTT